MKTIIVGNGSNVFKKENGGIIDNADCVVRMGSCKVRGYEKYVGTKTDIYRVSWDRLVCNKKHNYFLPYKAIPIRFNFTQMLFLELDPDTHNESFIDKKSSFNDNIFYKKFFSGISFPCNIFTNTRQRIMHDECLRFYKNNYNFKTHLYLKMDDRISAFRAVNNPPENTNLIIPSSGLLTLFYILRERSNDEIFITGFDGFKTRYYWRDYETSFTGHCSFREQLALKKLIKNKRIYEL